MATPSTPDLCVIGAGAAGLAVAEAARRVGASVVMVEKAEPGRASLQSGPLALRALAAAAERAALAEGAGAFGIGLEPANISFRRVRDHIAEIIAQSAPQGAAARIAALGIELVRGSGSFADPRTLRVGETVIEARRFVIATGASSSLPDIPGLLSVPYFTTETIFDNTRRPDHLVILGAGPMGLEIALCYRRLGTEVTIVEPGKMLPQSDPELVDIALRSLRGAGVVVIEEAAALAAEESAQSIRIRVRQGDGDRSITATHVLVAPARPPALDDLNLAAAKVRRSTAHAGALVLNASLRTTNSRIYAMGEAAGHSPHLVAFEADLVVTAALLGRPQRFEPAAFPRLTLTDPEIAEIGLTEPMARTRLKGGFSVLRASYGEIDRARAAREGMGVVKLVVGKSGKLLGAGIVGPSAGELAALFGLAIAQNLDARDLAGLAAPYPSYAELAQVLGEQARAATAQPRLKSGGWSLKRLLP